MVFRKGIAPRFCTGSRIFLGLNQQRFTSNVRVRFAPSPTGNLHLGGLRTALYNYLFARQNNGRFIVRIEDTDRSRLVPNALEKIISDLNWIGINIDEGPGADGPHGPYIQSERLDIYRQHISKLINDGSAYYCFCTEKRLDLLRKEAVRNRQIAKYDNRCRTVKPEEAAVRIKKGDPHCIRFKLENDDSCTHFDDIIYGKIQHDITKTEGDPIIVKSDGFPTYHVANVIDDHLMKISHVLRGVEWQISTPKHLMLYKAFNWTPPLFGHLPLLVDAKGNKLSKRQNDTNVESYRNAGIFPNALINFVTTSGGGFVNDEERGIKPKCYNLSQLTLRFNVKSIKSSPGKFDLVRLLEYNKLELENLIKDTASRQKLVRTIQVMVKNHLIDMNENLLQINSDHVEAVLCWAVERIQKLSDLLDDDLLYLWCIPDQSIDHFTDADVKVIRHIYSVIENDQVPFNKQSINRFLQNTSDKFNYNFPHTMQIMRMMLSGLKSGPSVADMMIILGKENSLLRMKMLIDKSVGKQRQRIVWNHRTASKQE